MHPGRRAGQLAQLVDAVARAAHDQHVVGEHEVLAVGVDDPVAAAPDRDDPHADVHRQVDLVEAAAREARALTDAHAVRHLFGRAEVGDERGRDAEAVGDDAADVDRGVAHALDRGHDVQHARDLLRVALGPTREHAHLAHLVDELVEPLLELADLVGHALVREKSAA